VSGAAARKLDYEDQYEEYDEEYEQEDDTAVASPSYYHTQTANEHHPLTQHSQKYRSLPQTTGYATTFTRQHSSISSGEYSLSAEPGQDYSQVYQQVSSSRRPRNRFAPLDSVLVGPTLLPKRLLGPLALILVGGIVIYFTLNTALSFFKGGTDNSRSIYPFSGSIVASNSEQTQAAPNPSSGDGHGLTSRPTISPAQIDAVLGQYKSPAVGSGQAVYDLGLRYGINPAYALAFFIHESSAGTQGVAAVTKSFGNIRCTPGYECYQTSGNGSFRRYSSWEAGAEDWYKLIKDQYIGKWGLKTLEQIIPVYAPSADRNNPTMYIQQVARLVESWRS